MKRFITLLLIYSLCISLFSCDNSRYNEAVKYMSNGSYEKAYDIFTSLGDYEKSQTYLRGFHFIPINVTITSKEESYIYKLTLDNNNLPTRSDIYYYDTFIGSIERIYDNNGIIVKETVTVNNNADHEVDNTEYFYDSNYNLIKEICIKSNGDRYIYDYTYDERRNLTKKLIANPNGERIIYEYKFDINDNLVSEVFTDANGKKKSTDYTYNDNGVIIKEVYTSPDGDKNYTDYTYDKKGNITYKVYTKPSGRKDTYTYTYDKTGKLIKEIYNNSSIRGESVYEYTYDDNGNIIKKVHISEGGDEEVYEYVYDVEGRVIKTSYSGSSISGESCTEYIYDEKGNLIQEILTNSIGGKNIRGYVYDEYGNILKLECIASNGDIKKYEIVYKLVYIPFDISEEEMKELLQYMIDEWLFSTLHVIKLFLSI